jgi:hypothetical protein
LLLQALPQPPQFEGSVCVVTQALLQSVQPSGQPTSHFPALQTAKPFAMEGHLTLQAPQCVGSLFKSAH